MPKLIVSLAQMNVALGNVQKNTEMMERLTVEAARRGSHLVVFPELWSTGGAWQQGKELASPLNGGTLAQVGAIAQQNKICIVGSVLEKRGLEISNTSTFFDPKGILRGVYRKIHLFRLMEEDKWLQRGEAPLVIDLPWGRTGMAICYDLRFPELFRRYAIEGARLVLLPAMWPIERVEHWRALLIARAIENQMYMIACNAVGLTGETTFAGHSMIVDPWGKLVVEAGETPMLVTAEIDLDVIDVVRQRIPVFDDRRPELY